MKRRVKLLTSRVLASGQTQEFGDEIELEPREADQLVAAGQAVVCPPAGGKPPARPNQPPTRR